MSHRADTRHDAVPQAVRTFHGAHGQRRPETPGPLSLDTLYGACGLAELGLVKSGRA